MTQNRVLRNPNPVRCTQCRGNGNIEAKRLDYKGKVVEFKMVPCPMCLTRGMMYQWLTAGPPVPS